MIGCVTVISLHGAVAFSGVGEGGCRRECRQMIESSLVEQMNKMSIRERS